jgi:ribonucleoside-diphosphate reductase alpha chain
MTTYTAEEVRAASRDYFDEDDLPAGVFTDKYALRRVFPTGVSEFYERTPDDMHRRMAREFARIEGNYPMAVSEERIYQALAYFREIVPQGSPMAGIGNPFALVSLSNCVVTASPRDTMSGIMETGRELANLYKRRCGVGVDMSTLRPAGSPVNNAALTSSGAASFCELYSGITRMTGQNGRRGALMLTWSDRHPDLRRFITMKQDTVSVRGANISTRVSDAFMQAVEAETSWILQWPVDVPQGRATHVVEDDARSLFRLMCESATKHAEPGLIYWDTYCDNLPSHRYPGFQTISTNPCSEIGLPAYDSCRLISIPLFSFVRKPFTADAYFDFPAFKQTVALGQRLNDDLVDLEIECLDKIIDACGEEDEKDLFNKMAWMARQGRRTGLGTHGLADLLVRMGLRYDSDEAIAFVDRVYEAFAIASYSASVHLAQERGPFPIWDWEIDQQCPFIQRLPAWLRDAIKLHGRRNIANMTMAPTGSVAIVGGSEGGGEPMFRLAYSRYRKINDNDTYQRVDRTDESGEKWQKYARFQPSIEAYFKVHPLARHAWEQVESVAPEMFWNERLQEILPDYFVTSDQIDPMQRVKMQGTIQKWIDHGISSTINLPRGTSVETVEAIYLAGWKAGLKGVTVYVEGSREGVLVSHDEQNPKVITESWAPKRPRELPCDLHHVTVGDDKFVILVSLLDGKPFEVFGGWENALGTKPYETGVIKKRRGEKPNGTGRMSVYDLAIDGDGTVEDIVTQFSAPTHGVLTRMASLALRHGVPPQFIAEQLRHDTDSHLNSFARVLARVLRRYVNEGATNGERCGNCGEKVVFSQGCTLCMGCGASKCS